MEQCQVIILTQKEVAMWLRISRSKAYRLMTEGTIKSFYIGERSLRTTNIELENYLHRQGVELSGKGLFEKYEERQMVGKH